MSIVIATALLLAGAETGADKFAPGGFIDTIRLDGAGKVTGCSEEAVGSVTHPQTLLCSPFGSQEALDHWLGGQLRGLSSLRLRMLFTPAAADGKPPAAPAGGTLNMTLASLRLTFDRTGKQSACTVEFQVPDFIGQAACDKGRESPQPIEADPQGPEARQAWLIFDVIGK